RAGRAGGDRLGGGVVRPCGGEAGGDRGGRGRGGVHGALDRRRGVTVGDWIVVAAGVAAIVWINRYFFLSGRGAEGVAPEPGTSDGESGAGGGGGSGGRRD